MKNGSVTDKLRMQERVLNTSEISFAGEKKKIVDVQTDENVKTQTNKNIKTISDTSIQQQTSLTVNQSIHQKTDGRGLSSLFSIPPSAMEINPTDEQQLPKFKKKKKRRPRLS